MKKPPIKFIENLLKEDLAEMSQKIISKFLHIFSPKILFIIPPNVSKFLLVFLQGPSFQFLHDISIISTTNPTAPPRSYPRIFRKIFFFQGSFLFLIFYQTFIQCLVADFFSNFSNYSLGIFINFLLDLTLEVLPVIFTEVFQFFDSSLHDIFLGFLWKFL